MRPSGVQRVRRAFSLGRWLAANSAAVVAVFRPHFRPGSGSPFAAHAVPPGRITRDGNWLPTPTEVALRLYVPKSTDLSVRSAEDLAGFAGSSEMSGVQPCRTGCPLRVDWSVPSNRRSTADGVP